MKKIFSLILLTGLLIACSKDDPASEDGLDTSDAITTTSSEIDFEAVNPFIDTPNRNFNNSSKGMYHGIVVTQDVSVHGRIWVNIANDGDYNATVITDEGNQMTFYGTPISRSQNIIAFNGKEGTFTFNVSDYNNPIATDVVLNGKEGYVQTVKDRSNQRANATLGTYADLNDPNFAGTWDLITDGTTVPEAFGLPALTQVCIVGPGGAMFIDDVFETFEYPCFSLNGPIAPTFHLAGGDFGNINEFWAQDQSVTLAGIQMDYWLGQSTSVHNGNPQFENPGFHNNNFADPPVAGCSAFTGGLQGIWFWNGRTGSATFLDPFAPPPPTRVNENADVEGLQLALSNVKFENASDASDLIE